MTSMPAIETVIQQAAQVHTLPQFKSWMRDHVRLALPHGALACVHGCVHAAGVSIDYLITVDYPNEHLDAIRNATGHIDTPIARRWLATRQVQTFDPDDPWPDVPAAWLAKYRRHQLGHLIAHATYDEERCIGTYFSFHRLPAAPGFREVETLTRLNPTLHATLMRVIHHYENGAEEDNPLAVNNVLLSARESQIARLIGAGKSNQDIALMLSLSENTVKHHVSRILDKTGCANRARIAAAVQQLSARAMGTKVL